MAWWCAAPTMSTRTTSWSRRGSALMPTSAPASTMVAPARYSRSFSLFMAMEAGLATTVVCGYAVTVGARTHSEGRGHAQNDLIPAAQRPREHGPEFGHFGAVSQHAFGARRSHVRIWHDAEGFCGDRNGVSRACAAQSRAQMKKPLTIDDYFQGSAGR